MTRVARLTSVTLALTIALISLPAMGEPAATSGLITLSLKDAPVQEALRLLAKEHHLDISISDDVEGAISLEVSNKTLEEVLNLIARTKNIHWWKEGDAVVVSRQPPSVSTSAPASEATALAKESRPKATRAVIQLQWQKAEYLAYLFGGPKEALTDYRSIEKIAYPYGEAGQQVGRPLASDEPRSAMPEAAPRAKTAAAVSRNPFEELSQMVQVPGVIEEGQVMPGTMPGAPGLTGATSGAPLAQLLPEGLTPPIAFAPLNALIVMGTSEAIEEFRKLVEILDVRVPQIMVEAQFVEMRVDDARQFGINWSWVGGETSVDVGGISPGGNITVTFVKGRFSSLLQAMVTSERARIVNAPRLATMNNQPVTFTVSRTYFYFTTSTVVQTPVFAGSQVFTQNVLNALPVVTSFTIRPQVNGDNTITVDVTTVISDVAGFITGPNGERIPEPTATSLPTRLRVENGDTIVMGGFVRKNISTSKRKVPLLSEIPILGKTLFTGTTYTESDSELLIFLTAYVLQEKGAAPALEGYRTIPLGQ